MTETSFINPHPTNTAFSAKLPGFQFAWDSTSLGALKTCPRYYYYSIIMGYASQGENAHLKFGLEFHAALELYDRKKAEGESHEKATYAAVRLALVNTWNFKLNRPWTSEEPTKTRETLVRAIVWYLDQFANDPLETLILSDGKPAVELSFRFETGLKSSNDEDILLCGHLDRVAYFQQKVYIVDRKTTKGSVGESYFAKYSPDNQMSLYDFAGTVVLPEPSAGIIIDAGQMQVNAVKFQRGFITRTQRQREEWFNDFAMWVEMAEGFARRQHWPQNEKACSSYSSYSGVEDSWRGGCPYRGICGISPEVREPYLRVYEQRIWNPLVTREV